MPAVKPFDLAIPYMPSNIYKQEIFMLGNEEYPAVSRLHYFRLFAYLHKYEQINGLGVRISAFSVLLSLSF